MQELFEVFSNRVLNTALIAWVLAQTLKVTIYSVTTRSIALSRIFESGGMPSSHAAFVVSLSLSIGFEMGFDSAVFALSAVFAMVVMYDAAGVRRAAGKQAKLLNSIVMHWIGEGKPPDHEQLKELLGHTPVEVFAGAVLGAMIAAWRL